MSEFVIADKNPPLLNYQVLATGIVVVNLKTSPFVTRPIKVLNSHR